MNKIRLVVNNETKRNVKEKSLALTRSKQTEVKNYKRK